MQAVAAGRLEFHLRPDDPIGAALDKHRIPPRMLQEHVGAEIAVAGGVRLFGPAADVKVVASGVADRHVIDMHAVGVLHEQDVQCAGVSGRLPSSKMSLIVACPASETRNGRLAPVAFRQSQRGVVGGHRQSAQAPVGSHADGRVRT